MVKIFSVGALKRYQAALREDGQWFVRERKERPVTHTMYWGKWEKVRERPANAWFNPANGTARLPVDEPA